MRDIEVEGIVTINPYLFHEKEERYEVLGSHTFKNLVTYRGRDYLAKRIALSEDEGNFFLNFVGVGRANYPAPELVQVSLYDAILYHAIDAREMSPTARGRITLTARIEGNEFSSSETVKEAGLFLSSYSAPGSVAIYDGNPYMFSRIVFPDPGFPVFPSTGSISQGFLLTWSVSF